MNRVLHNRPAQCAGTRRRAITLFGSGANSVIGLSGVDDDALTEQGEADAALHLALEHLVSHLEITTVCHSVSA